MFQDVFTPQRQAHVFAVGALIILTLGTLGAIAACLAAIWAVVELAQLLLTATVESFAAIGSTFASADSVTRVIILAIIGLVLYRGFRRIRRA